MRKIVFWLMLAVLCLCLIQAGAETTVALEPVSGAVTFNDNYIVLEPGTLSEHPELLSSIGTTQAEAEADWAARGVLAQAWTADRAICVEITAVQDEEAKQYFDVEQQFARVKKEYRSLHLKDSRFNSETYDVKSADWKQQATGIHLLILKYKALRGGAYRWGYARKTVRNGYTVTLDYQLRVDRALRETDARALNVIANTLTFDQQSETITESSAMVRFSEEPPVETSSDTFTVQGTCTPGAHVIGTLMRMSSSKVVNVTADANKKGDFKIKVKMPEEGVWLLTLTFDVGETTIAEHAFHTTTYSKMLLPVKLNEPIPEELESDELVISGVTGKAVTVQCIVNNGTSNYTKQVRTNGSGKFTFKVPTAIEGDYEIVLAFSKKGVNDRRFTYSARRVVSEQDIRSRVRSEAVKPSYTVLKNKLDGYIGRNMTYSVYITDISQLGEEWIIQAAMKSTAKGYSNPIVIIAKEDPGFVQGSQHRFYGTCIGLYQTQSEESTEGLPSFDLLWWE